ncbi:hypothetical protein [Leuconostoc mesenteroides]|uniref:hypothetical protein n=1 Tax=Leuconostoc mesenteroides TaxID=1245 RepID=UPI00385E03E1
MKDYLIRTWKKYKKIGLTSIFFISLISTTVIGLFYKSDNYWENFWAFYGTILAIIGAVYCVMLQSNSDKLQKKRESVDQIFIENLPKLLKYDNANDASSNAEQEYDDSSEKLELVIKTLLLIDKNVGDEIDYIYVNQSEKTKDNRFIECLSNINTTINEEELTLIEEKFPRLKKLIDVMKNSFRKDETIIENKSLTLKTLQSIYHNDSDILIVRANSALNSTDVDSKILGDWRISFERAKNVKVLIAVEGKISGTNTKKKIIKLLFVNEPEQKEKGRVSFSINSDISNKVNPDTYVGMELPELEQWNPMNPVLYYNAYFRN